MLEKNFVVGGYYLVCFCLKKKKTSAPCGLRKKIFGGRFDKNVPPVENAVKTPSQKNSPPRKFSKFLWGGHTF